MEIRIVGGFSEPNTIAILSDEFVATAQSFSNGHIACKVERRAPIARFILKCSHYPMPRLLYFMLAILSVFKKSTLILLALLFCAIYTLVRTYNPFPGWLTDHQETTNWIMVVDQILIIFLPLLYIWSHIATWHGAEHMAIAAYRRNKTVKIKDIEKESRVDDFCGTRFIVPIYLTPYILSFFFDSYNWIFYLVTVECLLWIDYLWGFWKIPIISHISWVLQKYILTRQPGEQELRTAQRALKKLILAHNSSIK